MTFHVTAGTIFQRYDETASPAAYTTVAQVLSLNGVNVSAEELDVTTIGDSWVQSFPGILNAEMIELGLGFDPDDADHAQMYADMVAGTARNYKITLTDSPAQTITLTSGRVFQFSRETPIRGLLRATVRIKPSSVTVA